MRKLLLLGTTALVLTFSAANARATAPSDEAALVALSQKMRMAFAGDQSLDGGSSFTNEGGAEGPVLVRREVRRSFPEDLATAGRNIALLVISGLVFGLGAVGTKALWMSDDTERASD